MDYTVYYAMLRNVTSKLSTNSESHKEVMKGSRRDTSINMVHSLDLIINRRCFELDL